IKKRQNPSLFFFKIPPFPSLSTLPFPSSKFLPSRTKHDENPNLNPILLISTSFLLSDGDPRREDLYRRRYIDGFVKYIVGYVMKHFGSLQREIKAKGDFMAMGGSFEKKRMKMND
uniref:Uncharacterized protein n=1 Tax=Cucumis melo TaxID=3656 RepID=A0A9I9EIV6_CUCME